MTMGGGGSSSSKEGKAVAASAVIKVNLSGSVIRVLWTLNLLIRINSMRREKRKVS